MDEMHPRNMSEDEQVEPLYPPVYRVRPAAWQSLELRQCFQTVDELYRSDWEGDLLAVAGETHLENSYRALLMPFPMSWPPRVFLTIVITRNG